jgi:hypothetical protein
VIRITTGGYHSTVRFPYDAQAVVDVSIDGHLFSPESSALLTHESALVALFSELPTPLRQPVYRALSKVLHPDVGGSDELMKQLNKAIGK